MNELSQNHTVTSCGDVQKADEKREASSMSTLKSSKRPVRRKQSGFTLIEIMMVVSAIGVLMLILIPNMRGGGATQEAQLMERVARSSYSGYELVNRACGTSNRISSNDIVQTKNSEGVAQLLFYGAHNNAYTRCYERAGVTPQSSDVDAADGDFRLTSTDMPISFEDQSSPRSFNIVFSNASSDVAEAVAQRFDTSAVLGDTGDFPSAAGDRAPINIAGTGDDLTITWRFLW